nr:MATE family efflux transporter [Maliibacterium massiliense]
MTEPQTRARGAYYRQLALLAAPIMLQNLLGALMYIADTVMIANVGDVEVAALGLCNQLAFMVQLFMFGISSGAAVYLSQYWGARDFKSIYRVKTLSVACSFSIATLCCAAVLIAPEGILRLFSNKDEAVEVVRRGAQYLRIVGPGYMLYALSFSLGMVLKATESPRLPMLAAVAGVSVNVAINYVLIFGHLGFPAMGVQGAAVGTVAGYSVELLMILFVCWRQNNVAALRPSAFARPSGRFAAHYFKGALPVFANEVLWSLGTTMYSVVFIRMGIVQYTAIALVGIVDKLVHVVGTGLANASGVLVGKNVGEGNAPGAKAAARRSLGAAAALGSVMLLLVLAGRGVVYHLPIKASAQARDLAYATLASLAVLMPVKYCNLVGYVGILRAGGDPRFCLIAEMSGMWLWSVPMAFLVGLGLGWTLPYVYLIAYSDEFLRVVPCFLRLRSGKWVKNLARPASKAPDAA